MANQTYTPGKFAKRIGVTVRTLQRWDIAGKLVAHRSASGRRFYTDDQYRAYMQLAEEENEPEKKTVCYTRVSSSGQKQDLKNQIGALEQFCIAKGLAVDVWLSDIGSGLNYERKNFTRLMQDVESGRIGKIVIAHKDRLVRFGYEWFQAFCQRHACEIIVVNAESLSPEEEVTQDLLTIIHCFSSRLYGLRRYKRELKTMISEQEPDA
jgi:putative resolvase